MTKTICFLSLLAATTVLAAEPAKSPNVTINLINRLVQKGVLSADDARDLIQQAEQDAAEAKAQAGAAPATKDTVSVRYVPEIVRLQIRDEIKEEIMQQARAENWAAPNAVPGWVSRFNVKGDIRVRYESLLFPDGNDNSGVFPNFNAINTGAPFDTTGTSFSPQRNVDQDRDRLRLRARIGAEINVGDGFTAGMRLATGDNNSPVSANQSLGAASSSGGGNFSKYAIWLDRGFLQYQLGGTPKENLTIAAGRFDNPFYTTSEVVWDSDLGFDGFAVRGKKQFTDGVTPFFAAGIFPVFNTDLNFSSNRPDKFASTDKWLYGGQLGMELKITDDLSFKGAGAYYYFDGVEGRLSKPFVPLTAQDQGDTDNTRPAFAQYGNTYRPLRNITPAAANDFGTKNQWQYFGLASKFQDVVVAGSLDFKRFEPFTMSLFGEFVLNTAFDKARVNAIAVNNRGGDGTGPFVGGDMGWIAGLKLGHVALQKRWDWNLTLDYRYVESDAVVDGFCDSDFGGGGTNVKGFSISGQLALAPHVFLGARWMSSDQVAGPQLKNDTVQVDVSAKF